MIDLFNLYKHGGLVLVYVFVSGLSNRVETKYQQSYTDNNKHIKTPQHHII